MTSIKEALERIKRTALDAKPEDVPKALAHIVRLCIDADRALAQLELCIDADRALAQLELCIDADRALAQLESADARERVAQAVTAELERMYKDGAPMCMREGETTWRIYYAGFDLSMFANRIVDAILATGLVPDEAAVRAEITEARQEAADSLAILDAIADYVGCPHDEELTVDHVRQHYLKLEDAAQRQGIEDAGRIANAQAYCAAREQAIRADERERCAGPDLLAVMEKECWTLRCVDIPTGGGDADVAWDVVSHHMAKPHDRVIATGNTPIKALAAAIRAGGEK